MELLIFYPLAGICIGLALAVILNKSPIGSAGSLIGMMLGLAGIFVLLHAHFIAILQVLVYAGAIMVLFMFVIMLLNLKTEDTVEWKSRSRNTLWTVLTVVLALTSLCKFALVGSEVEFNSPQAISNEFGTTAAVGKLLFTDYVLPFEVASILLLVAMIGAVVLAKTKFDQ